MDWYHAWLGSKYAYTIELRPHLNNIFTNFLLDKEEIIPSGEEMWAAMEVILARLKKELNNTINE